MKTVLLILLSAYVPAFGQLTNESPRSIAHQLSTVSLLEVLHATPDVLVVSFTNSEAQDLAAEIKYVCARSQWRVLGPSNSVLPNPKDDIGSPPYQGRKLKVDDSRAMLVGPAGVTVYAVGDMPNDYLGVTNGTTVAATKLTQVLNNDGILSVLEPWPYQGGYTNTIVVLVGQNPSGDTKQALKTKAESRKGTYGYHQR